MALRLRWWISVLLVMVTTWSHKSKAEEGIKGATALHSHSPNPRGTLQTIQTEYGEVVDCVDIHQQLMKKQSLQMRPNSMPRSVKLEDVLSSPIQSWSCPRGTVPIRGPLKNKFDAIILPFNVSNDKPQRVNKYAVVTHRHTTADIYGVSGVINVWKPLVEASDFTLAQIWITNDLTGQMETLQAGWQIYPNKYGDHEPRLFIFYTKDGYKTLCYVSECDGFVVTDPSIGVGTRILEPYSVYNGEQKEIEIAIVKDESSKNWWFYYEKKAVGYWRATYFKGLLNGANGVEWGGEIAEHPNSNHPSTTQMGSGRFSNEQTKKAAYIRNLFYLDVNHKPIIPFPVNYVVTRPDCYSITPLAPNHASGAFFYFGGPGRSKTCT